MSFESSISSEEAVGPIPRKPSDTFQTQSERMERDLEGLPKLHLPVKSFWPLSKLKWNTLSNYVLHKDASRSTHSQSSRLKYHLLKPSQEHGASHSPVFRDRQLHRQKMKTGNQTFNDAVLGYFDQIFEDHNLVMNLQNRYLSQNESKHRIDHDIPMSLIQQHINDKEFTQNRRLGLLGRMRTILRKHTFLVTTLNYWTKKSQSNKSKFSYRQSVVRNLKHQPSAIVLKQADLVGRKSENYSWKVEHHQNKTKDKLIETHGPLVHHKGMPVIDYSSSSSSCNGSQSECVTPLQPESRPFFVSHRRTTMFDIMKKVGHTTSQTVQNYVKRNSTVVPTKIYSINALTKIHHIRTPTIQSGSDRQMTNSIKEQTKHLKNKSANLIEHNRKEQYQKNSQFRAKVKQITSVYVKQTEKIKSRYPSQVVFPPLTPSNTDVWRNAATTKHSNKVSIFLG